MSPEDVRTETCPRCDGRGWVIEDDGAAGTARPCDCRAQERIQERLQRARIPERYRHCTLANFNVDVAANAGDRERLFEARAICEAYVEEFIDLEGGGYNPSGLLLVGRPGTGKTHLAAAVLRELILKYGVDGLFVDFTTLVHDIQATFDSASTESKSTVLDPVMKSRVLVLDELAAQKPSPWVHDTLYLIMNARYTRKLPTLFTTNYALGPDSDQEANRHGEEPTLATRIHARLVSRLHQMARPVFIHADDYRKHIKAHALRS